MSGTSVGARRSEPSPGARSVPDLAVYLVTAGPAGPATIDVVDAAVAGGVRCVQLRDKDCGTAERVRVLRRLQRRIGERPVTLIVNDDVRAAAAVPGVGLHVGPDDCHPAEARRLLGDRVCLGWSIHHEEQLADVAAVQAVDYLAVSPVWPTPTKPDTTQPWGLDGVGRLRQLVSAPLPIVAIGGVGAHNADQVIRAGADGVAVVSAICSAADPRRAAADLCAVVGRAAAAKGRG